MAPERELMAKVAKLKLQYCGHVTPGSVRKPVLIVLEESTEGNRASQKSKKSSVDDVE